MKISFQSNTNECGLYVLQSLIQHYHHKKISINELLNQVNLTNDGLSIYDLENLGYKYGLNLDSYECELEEFKNNYKNKYVIIILKQHNRLHYVIALNKGSKIIIFCSEQGQYEISWEQLQDKWIGVLIECHKNKFQPNIKTNITNGNWMNWKLFLFCNIINIVILLLALFNATFFQQLFNYVIDNNTISNITTIIFIFLITTISKYLGDYFINILSYKEAYKYYAKMQMKCCKKISNKYLTFFSKINNEHLRNLDEHLFNIATFYTITINKAISSILLVLLGLIFIFTINLYIALILLSIFVITLLVDYLIYYLNKKNINTHQQIRNEYKESWINYINFNKEDQHIKLFNLNISKVKNNQFKIKQIYEYNLWTFSTINVCQKICCFILYLVVIIISVHFILKQDISIAKLSLIISLSQLILSSSSDVFMIIKSINPLKYAKQIFNTISEVDNKISDFGTPIINNIKNILFNNVQLINDTVIYGRCGAGKTTMFLKIANMLKRDHNDEIKINEINLQNIQQSFFKNNVIYLTNNPQYDLDLIQSLMENNDYADIALDIIQSLQIKEWSKLSLGQKQALSFLSLIKEKNKIILLDEIIADVDSETKHLLLTKIKPIISKANFVCMISHDKFVHQYFNNQVEYA